MPIGQVIEHNGAEYKAFNLEEWKQVSHFILDYHLLFDYALSLEAEYDYIQEKFELYQDEVDLWKAEAKRQNKRGNILSKMFDREHKFRLSLEKRDKMWNWIPWTLVVVESVAVGFLGAYSLHSASTK